ncbi:hypothetical protein LTR05_006239 [Lithohypha guttulata]|uniref:Uncharacterized protein n=1 Tax=Lithohypha guttulata TaxID=1690604 RepID=A0AAN7YEU4_9EURO|nr:hypothetical protein LTR05_006239 [Lithohypha guttulata]
MFDRKQPKVIYMPHGDAPASPATTMYRTPSSAHPSGSNFQPEIVVGIDFGMTCTGVAYSMAPDWSRPTTIQHWPGRLGHENRNKVATTIAYDSRTSKPASWGFLVDEDDPNLDIQQYFKLYLDPAHDDEFRNAPNLDDARRWYVDYLRCIHHAVCQHFDASYPRWRGKPIEFLFSVPTTWRNPGMIGELESLIRHAGFGERPEQKVVISLTEAEAAAVYASKQHYQSGEVFLVCDAGGGTTDVNVLKVASDTMLTPLSFVEGSAIGSSLIDYKMEERILERLESIKHHLLDEPVRIAEQMISSGGRFETFKCSFGTEALQVLDLLIPVPGLPQGKDFPQAGIFDGKMVITKQDLQKIFDEQVERICDLIDGELRKLQVEHAKEQVSYIVLSGGLGSSPYVRQWICKRYESGTFSNARNLRVLTALEPQLAVTHGLVIDRAQELKSGAGVFLERCCRNSYGVVVRAPYDPITHMGEDVVIDPRDGMKWAERQIDWIIKQGQRIDAREGIRQQHRLKLDLGKERHTWRTQIVCSSLPPTQLPKSMKWEGTKPVCVVESIIDGADLKLKNKHWYNLGKQYIRADFALKILIGPADLKFQLWGRDKQLSKSHDQIAVQWNPLNTRESVAMDQKVEMYKSY